MPTTDNPTLPKTGTKKILIAGIGGVGGFFGGLLAKAYEKNTEVEICFLARGKHLKAIQEKGLQLIHGKESWIIHPQLATDKVEEIGPVDVVILCTKTYDLEEICQQILPCLHLDTIVLPLLNGVNNVPRIQKMIPENLVLEGCVYLVSRILEAGVIENSGNLQRLYFGSAGLEDERLEHLEAMFRQAGIEASLSPNISQVIWEKFIFLSSIATATSYFDCSIGSILANPQQEQVLRALVEEVRSIAEKKGIPLDPNISRLTFDTFSSLPAHITSSMHRDFKAQKTETEIEALTGYVVAAGKAHEVKTPVFDTLYARLKK